jgi:hypothetical protein
MRDPIALWRPSRRISLEVELANHTARNRDDTQREADGAIRDEADTLSLRGDSVAVEMGVFSYKRAGAGPTAPIVGVEADSVRGRSTVTDGRLIGRTWMDVDDTVDLLDGGAHLRRAVIVWNFRPTRIKPVLTYQRMQ